MKWGFCFLLFAGVSLLLAAEDMEVTGSRVNIRQSPSTRGTVIGSVKAGERVKVKEVKNGWAALEDRPGFVFASFLRKAGAVPDPVKPAPPKPAKPAVVTQTAPGQIFADLPVEAGSKRDVTVKGLLFPLKKSKGRVAYALLKAVGGKYVAQCYIYVPAKDAAKYKEFANTDVQLVGYWYKVPGWKKPVMQVRRISPLTLK